MTVFKRYWFPASVIALLAIIAVNLYALSFRQNPVGANGDSDENRHAHAKGKDNAKTPANKDHHAANPSKDAPATKKDLADHAANDHKGMMEHKGMMGKGMMGMMHGNMADMMDIRFLLFNHEKIKRTVKRLPEGVETETTSTDEAVAGKIEAHVKAMYERLKKKQVIRPMDPLFVALFENADKIHLEMTKLPNGVRVKETSKDPYAVKLIHAHAEAVDRFVKDGMSAMMKFTSVPDRDGSVIDVRWSGELKSVMMKGDLKGTIDLATIAKVPHLYAVGALEDLQGEVTILDGATTLVSVRDGKQVVSHVPTGKASVLVYSQVKRWNTFIVPNAIRSLDELEAFVVATAKKDGINVDRPFPFVIEGKLAEIKYHVLRHPGEFKDSQELHAKAQVPFTFSNGVGELLGFYSDKHLGIFTCQSNLHVHLRSADGAASGHVDELKLDKGVTVFLPAH